MNLIGDILRHSSLAVVGLEKNTGKTECLNYILRNLPAGVRAAVTSVGTDGERTDAVTHTAKPEIWLREGVVFGTAEKYYAGRGVVSEVLDVGARATSLGRTVTARALSAGRMMLSGPPSTAELKRWIDSLDRFGVELTIVDGALSRMSLASPAVTQALVLSSGAAFSADMGRLVRETAYRVELIMLPLANESHRRAFDEADRGIWEMDDDGKAVRVDDAQVSSLLSAKGDYGPKSGVTAMGAPEENVEDNPLAASNVADGAKKPGRCTFYIAGALTKRALGMLCSSGVGSAGGTGEANVPVPKIIVADFTKIFLSSEDYRSYCLRGGELQVLRRSELLAVCVNPVAPNGMTLNSEELVRKMSEAVPVPVYDIMKAG